MKKIKDSIINTLLGFVIMGSIIGVIYLVITVVQALGIWTLYIILVVLGLMLLHGVGDAIMDGRRNVEKR